jgi:hypothetical protein
MSIQERISLVGFYFGVALVLGGQTIYRYVHLRITDLETHFSVSLPENEYYATEGSLRWWRAEAVSFYDPLALYILTAGLIVIICIIAFVAVKLYRKRKV